MTFFFLFFARPRLFPRIASQLIFVEPLAVLLSLASGENQLVPMYAKIVCESEKHACACYRYCRRVPGAEKFTFHTSSTLPGVYLDPREIPSNSLFVSLEITFKR